MTYTAEIVLGHPHELGTPTYTGTTCDHKHRTQHAAWMCAASLAKQQLPSQREASYAATLTELHIKVLENR